jgi:hypothetical protein
MMARAEYEYFILNIFEEFVNVENCRKRVMAKDQIDRRAGGTRNVLKRVRKEKEGKDGEKRSYIQA